MLCVRACAAAGGGDRAQPGVTLTQGGVVVFSGAGTSGRLAVHAAEAGHMWAHPTTLSPSPNAPKPVVVHKEHHAMNPGMWRYLMAGGDAAIVKSAESVEDDPQAAIRCNRTSVGV